MARWHWFACFASLLGCRGETVDAQTSASADTGPGAGVELLNNADFELGCGGWEAAEANAEESTVARNGARSCLVCGRPTVDTFWFGQVKEGPFVEGTTYVAEGFLRAPDGDAGIAPDPMARLELLDDDWNQVHVIDTGSLTLDGTWKRVSNLVTIKPGTKRLRLEFWSHGKGPCFLVDDASLRVAR